MLIVGDEVINAVVGVCSLICPLNEGVVQIVVRLGRVDIITKIGRL